MVLPPPSVIVAEAEIRSGPNKVSTVPVRPMRRRAAAELTALVPTTRAAPITRRQRPIQSMRRQLGQRSAAGRWL